MGGEGEWGGGVGGEGEWGGGEWEVRMSGEGESGR